MRRYIDESTRIIAISKYLTSYFQQKQYPVTTIPAVLDVENTEYIKNKKSEKLILMYAGSVGRKDYLDVVLNGLALLNREDFSKIEFRIFGATFDEIKDNFGVEIASKITNCVACYGKVDRTVVLKHLEDADFTVLMRSSTQRYAKAGFPTKVVESLAGATPVICNLTSDLADYIVDGYNGIVVNSESAEDFSWAIKKAICCSVREKEIMSRNARKTAEKHFDYRLYKDEMIALMDDF
jgi:glycosyltransferase involved in cell wall biosynthesis